MPINFENSASEDCEFSEWKLPEGSREVLIDALAYLYLLQESNAERIISSLEPRLRAPRGRVAENVVEKLTAPKPSTLAEMASGTEQERESATVKTAKQVEHRDGLLFQHISWVAARIEMPSGHLTAPHVRSADKGFDGFVIEMNDSDETLERIVLCEDKASKSPRRLITGSVWPEIESIRNGDRDDEILADLTTLVRQVTGHDEEKAEHIVDTAFWEEVQQFRVSVATSEGERRNESFAHLMNGFSEISPGCNSTRMGGVLSFPEVRAGLAQIAQEVIERVQSIDQEASA